MSAKDVPTAAAMTPVVEISAVIPVVAAYAVVAFAGIAVVTAAVGVVGPASPFAVVVFFVRLSAAYLHLPAVRCDLIDGGVS